jgi:hypothetical protein
VDKSQFLQILQRYADTSVEEAKQISALKVQFPYSQVLQTLAARASKDHALQNQQSELQYAAVYAADRTLLKELITAAAPEPVNQIQVISKHVHADEQITRTIDSVDVADVIMNDLERLAKLKSTFENLFMDYPKSKKVRNETVEIDGAIAEKILQPNKEVTKSKKERIIEMAKAMNPQSVEDGLPQNKKRAGRLDKYGNPMDELIAEIQSSKDELIPESDKQKQQIEIINQFIRIQPSISNPKDRAPSPIGDLNPVKSGEFGDNIVSETLVEILIKQGKKDKAIEVLKKLIWKYPQKKAYFASQIEDLKK